MPFSESLFSHFIQLPVASNFLAAVAGARLSGLLDATWKTSCGRWMISAQIWRALIGGDRLPFGKIVRWTSSAGHNCNMGQVPEQKSRTCAVVVPTQIVLTFIAFGKAPRRGERDKRGV